MALKLGAKKMNVPFHACTFLADCTPEGSTTHRALESGGAEFSRAFVHQGTLARCTVVDRFIPAKSSIRWEVEILGAGDPWSTAIETQLAWLNPSNARFWTAWDGPPEKGSRPAQKDSLKEMLDQRERIAGIRNVFGQSGDEAEMG